MSLTSKHVVMLYEIRLKQGLSVVVFLLDRGRKCVLSNRGKDK
jgi:hypothetical protein